MLSHKKTVALLSKYKIPYARTVVGDRKKALSANKFPVVLKIVSLDIIHKTDAGGVVTGIESKAELQKAISAMEKLIKKKYPRANYEFMVQEQLAGHEIIIGMKRDRQFGPVIAFGLGGVFVELFKDVSLKIAPLSAKDINNMIEEIKAKKILEGYRGSKPVNMAALRSMLKNFSDLAMREKDIAEIDFNPVIVNEKTAVVVDARMIEDA